MATTEVGMGGQSAPKQRQAGQWVEVEAEEGIGPDSWEGEGQHEVSLGKMKRAELDNLARSQGLNPDDYSNADELRKAIQK